MNMNGTGVIKLALADNHQLMRECLQNYLSQFEYSILLQANNGGELLQKITTKNLPDICIMEIDMRQKTGYEIMKLLKAQWPTMKIIIYSLRISQKTKQKKVFADVIISKQTSLAELKETLDRLVKPEAAQIHKPYLLDFIE
jgi:DNA-binding NarL/FixJ family response regulator